jgi:hypothetical protein
MASRTGRRVPSADVADEARRVFERLRDLDPSGEDRDAVVAHLDDCRRIKSFVEAIEVRCTRRLRELAAEGRAESPETALSGSGGRSRRDAAKAKGREQVTEAMPGFGDALESGAIAAGHLDAVADATKNLTDEVREQFHTHHDDLLAAAAVHGVDDFERECRELARLLAATADADAEIDEMDRLRRLSRMRRCLDRDTGLKRTIIDLDPVRDEVLHRVLRAHLRALRHREPNSGRPLHELEVDALMAALAAAGSGDATASAAPLGLAPVPEIGVFVSLEWLLGQITDHGLCETYDGIPVPIATVRKWCCDAEIIPYLLGTDGAVTDMGRTARTVSREQRRRLRAMHRTCAHPQCDTSFEECRIHHVRFWTLHHGPTDIDNLLPLCQRHHTLVHEGGWTLTMTPDRVATWVRPDGTTQHVGSTMNRTRAPIARASTGRAPPDQAA